VASQDRYKWPCRGCCCRYRGAGTEIGRETAEVDKQVLAPDRPMLVDLAFDPGAHRVTHASGVYAAAGQRAAIDAAEIVGADSADRKAARPVEQDLWMDQ